MFGLPLDSSQGVFWGQGNQFQISLQINEQTEQSLIDGNLFQSL